MDRLLGVCVRVCTHVWRWMCMCVCVHVCNCVYTMLLYAILSYLMTTLYSTIRCSRFSLDLSGKRFYPSVIVIIVAFK